eukprot:357335-Chlamydomonas_euryale.AAC.2
MQPSLRSPKALQSRLDYRRLCKAASENKVSAKPSHKTNDCKAASENKGSAKPPQKTKALQCCLIKQMTCKTALGGKGSAKRLFQATGGSALFGQPQGAAAAIGLCPCLCVGGEGELNPESTLGAPQRRKWCLLKGGAFSCVEVEYIHSRLAADPAARHPAAGGGGGRMLARNRCRRAAHRGARAPLGSGAAARRRHGRDLRAGRVGARVRIPRRLSWALQCSIWCVTEAKAVSAGRRSSVSSCFAVHTVPTQDATKTVVATPLLSQRCGLNLPGPFSSQAAAFVAPLPVRALPGVGFRTEQALTQVWTPTPGPGSSMRCMPPGQNFHDAHGRGAADDISKEA